MGVPHQPIINLISCFSSTSLIDFLRLTLKKHSTNPYTNPSLNLCEQAFEKHMVYYAEMPSSWPRFPAKRPNVTSCAVFLFILVFVICVSLPLCLPLCLPPSLNFTKIRTRNRKLNCYGFMKLTCKQIRIIKSSS